MQTIKKLLVVILVFVAMSFAIGVVALKAESLTGSAAMAWVLVILTLGFISLFCALEPHWQRLLFVEKYYAKDEAFIQGFIRQIATHDMVEEFIKGLAINVAEASSELIKLRGENAGKEEVDAAIEKSRIAFEHFEDQRQRAMAGYAVRPCWKQYLGKEGSFYTASNGVRITLSLSKLEKRRVETCGITKATFEIPLSDA